MNDSSAPGPLARYRTAILEGALQRDPRQEALAGHLDEIYQGLIAQPRRWWERWKPRTAPVHGLYIHGRVGRGKTMLMDLLVSSLDERGEGVFRTHFHRFMADVHDQLAKLDGQSDPLSQVAADLARNTRLLCFDEFHVSDIGDAMILAELLHQLIERGVVLIATSNSAPDDLYADGLQRARFLPAIDLIKRSCRIFLLDARADYRLRALKQHPVYHWPENAASESELDSEFRTLAAGESISRGVIDIRGRAIQPRARAGSVVWFDFSVLCEGPRASADYIELARRFSTMIISGVPAMDEQHDDAARRFVHLIDECYDRGVKLIISAAAAAQNLYQGKRLVSVFERTASRLVEMQSHDYLARPHKP